MNAPILAGNAWHPAAALTGTNRPGSLSKKGCHHSPPPPKAADFIAGVGGAFASGLPMGQLQNYVFGVSPLQLKFTGSTESLGCGPDWGNAPKVAGHVGDKLPSRWERVKNFTRRVGGRVGGVVGKVGSFIWDVVPNPLDSGNLNAKCQDYCDEEVVIWRSGSTSGGG